MTEQRNAKTSMDELVAGCPLLIAKEQKDDVDAEWCGSGFTRKEDGDVDFLVDFASKVLDAGGFEFHSVCLPPDKVFKRMKRSEYLEHRMSIVRRADHLQKWKCPHWGLQEVEVSTLVA